MSITYIDFQKAYDSVPHPWIIETLRTYKISTVIINFLEHAMTMWEINLVLRHDKGSLEVTNIKIKRGIFQGDTLSPLLFVIAINPLSYLLNKHGLGYCIDGVEFSHTIYMDDIKTFSKNADGGKKMALIMYDFSTSIGMSFGIEKCKTLNIIRGKYSKCGGVRLPDGNVISEMENDEVYKYLGVIESIAIKHTDMKQKVLESFKRRLKSILKTELNARNIMTAIGEYAIPVVSYTFAIINWTEDEVKGIDITVRKYLNLFKMFQIKSDVDRLYTPRAMGGRGLISVWDSFKATMVRVSHYLNESTDNQMQVCTKFDKSSLFSIVNKAEKFTNATPFESPPNLENKTILKQAKTISHKFKEAIHKERHDKFIAKSQHGVFFRQMGETKANAKGSLSWLLKCHLSPQSEAYICGLQELAIFTRWHERHILKNRLSDTCRVCGIESETTTHLLAGCGTLAKKEYLDRHNNVARYIHRALCDTYNIQTESKWHLHRPTEVIMNKNIELLWDMTLNTDRQIGANKPDIVLRDKTAKKTYIIDISCPSDMNVQSKENEKVAKYSGLRAELGKMWNCECVVIPVVIGGLGVISEKFLEYLKMVPAQLSMEMCIKITLLGSEKIMRSVLSRK